jgi:hypothetical protein
VHDVSVLAMTAEPRIITMSICGCIKLYKITILPILYGCETWFLTLREEHSLRVFESKVLRNIFGYKIDEVTGEWRDSL